MSDTDTQNPTPTNVNVAPTKDVDADHQLEKPKLKRPRTAAQLEALRIGREKRSKLAAQKKAEQQTNRSKIKLDQAKERVRKLMENAERASSTSESDSESDEIESKAPPPTKSRTKAAKQAAEYESDSGSDTDESRHEETPYRPPPAAVRPHQPFRFI